MDNVIKKEILEELNESEKELVVKILKEYSSNGQSDTFNSLAYADYKEIPVDIETFISDDRYLGQAWKDAKGNLKMYPFWLGVLKEIFPNNIDTNYSTLLESGARGIGKSEIACGAVGAYLMYRVLCLKNPLEYYHLKPTEKICFAFMNIKLDLSEDIAISKFQKTIQLSPWFMSRGKMTTYKTEPYWIPPEPIQIIIGSQSDDVIGQPIYYCLKGDTIVNTLDGDFKIEDLVDKEIKVNNVDDKGNLVESNPCTVKMTGEYKDVYELELEDGSKITCTPNHRFMLIDGTYKEAQYLTEDDEILDFKPFGYIYKTTNNVNGKIYIGQHEWHETSMDNKYLGSGLLLKEAFKKYGRDNFTCEILKYCKYKEELDKEEIYYISKYESTNNKKGYNIAAGGRGGNLGDEVNLKISESLKGKPCSEEKKLKLSKIFKGRPSSLTKEGRLKISKANKEKVISEETRYKMSISAKNVDRSNRVPSLKNKKAITSGKDVKYINKDEKIPENWRLGNCKTAGKHDMSNYTEEMRAKRISMSLGKNNNMYGKGYKVKGSKNGKCKYIYTYKGIEFECRKYLLEYLNKKGIVLSVGCLRDLENGKCSDSLKNKYKDILKDLTWRNKNENKKDY